MATRLEAVRPHDGRRAVPGPARKPLHDGKPDEPDKSWWGTVTGFQPPGSIDFHHTIRVKQLRTKVDVHIHYSFEPDDKHERRTRVNRWLLLDVTMPLALRPLRRAITSAFDKENVWTLTAAKQHAERHPDMDLV